MKILIISFFYKPLISPRAFRWTTLAEYWNNKKNRIDVVSIWKPGLNRYEVLEGINVYRVGGGLTEILRSWLVGSEGNLMQSDNAYKDSSNWKLDKKLFSGFTFAAKWIHDMTWKKVYWPDFACLWYLPAIKMAKRLLKNKSYDVIISVSYPFTSHLVGMCLKVLFPLLRWVVDIGDPFCFQDRNPVNNYSLYKRLNFLIERKIFSLADSVAVTTDLTLKKYALIFPESVKKIYVIPPLLSNNIDVETRKMFFQKNEKTRLVYIGNLHKNIRDPKFILELFYKLLQINLNNELELHFFGATSEVRNYFDSYKQLIEKKIFLHGLVEPIQAKKIMKEADLLINIGNVTSYQLPSKLVDYISTGKPILNIVNTKQDSSWTFLKRYPSSLNLINNGDIPTLTQITKLAKFIKNLPICIGTSKIHDLLSSHKIEVIARAYENLLK